MIFLGLMSGTSLDGLDAVFCSFRKTRSGYKYTIHHAETLEYEEPIRRMLLDAPSMNGLDLIRADRKFGHYLGKRVKDLIGRIHIVPYMVVSHGHTIFHLPDERLTLQIGHGPSIAAECELPVMFDFRSLDVALGGQGAPLVPIGDQLLFGKYDACLNLGGFANVSMEKEGKRVAWDICPANFIANRIAQFKGMDFDRNGAFGASGNIIYDLLERMESLDYYLHPYPKSLGREWIDCHFSQILASQNTPEDILRTYYEHVANRIVSDIDLISSPVLCTGGGVKNTFLMKLIAEKATWNVVIPEKEIIDFKEALIFAFLAFLKLNGTPNCLSSVTGASKDNLSG
ncbi:MAG: anhydro-N-acetylmuramic acid kinase, partial [Bacteroidales bacterium]|nr:anhydro-N-acetylmuramic acid kinase [Bacteroidales bacterium]